MRTTQPRWIVARIPLSMSRSTVLPAQLAQCGVEGGVGVGEIRVRAVAHRRQPGAQQFHAGLAARLRGRPRDHHFHLGTRLEHVVRAALPEDQAEFEVVTGLQDPRELGPDFLTSMGTVRPDSSESPRYR